MKKVILCAPSRIYGEHRTGRFSYSSMVDLLAKVGFSGIDMSFEVLPRDDWGALRGMLYAAKERARSRGICIPVCHLSFYMPSPDNAELMRKFSRELMLGIDAAEIMEIPMAVTHPIAIRSGKCTYDEWLERNIGFLLPTVSYASKRNVRLCIENMANTAHSDGELLYGSSAEDVATLARHLGAGVCWDVGHANVSGYKNSEQMNKLRGEIDVLHIHDNNGERDEHLLPYDGSVDWGDVARGIAESGFCGVLDVEATAWALDSDRDVRDSFCRLALCRAQRLMNAAELI